MGKVDKAALAVYLNELQRIGLVKHWEPRPLGMYIVVRHTGEMLRPDAKETAMWVQGAMSALEFIHDSVETSQEE